MNQGVKKGAVSADFRDLKCGICYQPAGDVPSHPCFLGVQFVITSGDGYIRPYTDMDACETTTPTERRSYISWSYRKTLALIDTYSRHMHAQRKKAVRKIEIFDLISKDLLNINNIQATGRQCMNKYAALLDTYRCIVDDMHTSGNDPPRHWEFFIEMNRLHGSKPDCKPLAVASNLEGYKYMPEDRVALNSAVQKHATSSTVTSQGRQAAPATATKRVVFIPTKRIPLASQTSSSMQPQAACVDASALPVMQCGNKMTPCNVMIPKHPSFPAEKEVRVIEQLESSHTASSRSHASYLAALSTSNALCLMEGAEPQSTCKSNDAACTEVLPGTSRQRSPANVQFQFPPPSMKSQSSFPSASSNVTQRNDPEGSGITSRQLMKLPRGKGKAVPVLPASKLVVKRKVTNQDDGDQVSKKKSTFDEETYKGILMNQYAAAAVRNAAKSKRVAAAKTRKPAQQKSKSMIEELLATSVKDARQRHTDNVAMTERLLSVYEKSVNQFSK